MKLKHIVAAALAALLCTSSALAAAPADQVAQQPASMDGIDAIALGAAEMDDIHGALTALDLYNALVAKAGLITNDALRNAVLAYLEKNRDALLRYFALILSFRR
jgi:hypothetical protein